MSKEPQTGSSLLRELSRFRMFREHNTIVDTTQQRISDDSQPTGFLNISIICVNNKNKY